MTTKERVSSFPDLPTIADTGLPGYNVDGWVGMFAPAGTPEITIACVSEPSVSVSADAIVSAIAVSSVPEAALGVGDEALDDPLPGPVVDDWDPTYYVRQIANLPTLQCFHRFADTSTVTKDGSNLISSVADVGPKALPAVAAGAYRPTWVDAGMEVCAAAFFNGAAKELFGFDVNDIGGRSSL